MPILFANVVVAIPVLILISFDIVEHPAELVTFTAYIPEAVVLYDDIVAPEIASPSLNHWYVPVAGVLNTLPVLNTTGTGGAAFIVTALLVFPAHNPVD